MNIKIIKRTIALILSLIVMVSGIDLYGIDTKAATLTSDTNTNNDTEIPYITVSSYFGEYLDFTWTFYSETGTLKIEGKGDPKSVATSSINPWRSYANHIKNVEIESTVKPTDMDYWFYNFPNLEYINTIPDTVKSLTHTFSGCTSLTEVPDIPYSVESMQSTFYNCDSLTGEINILSKDIDSSLCSDAFLQASTDTGANLKVNYNTNNESKVDMLIATKSINSNITKGRNLDVIASGTFGINNAFTWVISSNGKLSIGGNGDPGTDFQDNEEVPWYGYEREVKSVEIASTVKPKNMNNWFVNCVNLITTDEHQVTILTGESEATCENDGYTGDTRCVICNKILEHGDKITATPHDMDDGVITTEPTVEEFGIKTYTCLVCGHTETETVDKLDAENPEDNNENTDTATDGEDTNGDGIPDLNVDTNGDGIADLSINTGNDSNQGGNTTPENKPNTTDKTVDNNTDPTIINVQVNLSNDNTKYDAKLDDHMTIQTYPTNNYTIKFNGNGGKVIYKSAKVKIGSKLSRLTTPTKKGYTFKGWYTAKKGGKKVTSNTVITKSMTVYAQWAKVKLSKAKIKSAKFKNKTLNLVMKKISGAKGYQVSYSTNKRFKKAKIKTSKKNTYKINKLTKGKTYFVRVRAFKKDSTGKKVFGKWSIVKKVIVK